MVYNRHIKERITELLQDFRLVLERSDGKVVGIEVKASMSIKPDGLYGHVQFYRLQQREIPPWHPVLYR